MSARPEAGGVIDAELVFGVVIVAVGVGGASGGGDGGEGLDGGVGAAATGYCSASVLILVSEVEGGC